MKKVRVTNTDRSRPVVVRLGRVFSYNEPVELTVSDRQLLILRAARPLEVIVEEEEKSGPEEPRVAEKREESEPHGLSGGEIREMTVDEVLEMVEKGRLSAEDALKIEEEGKRRVTLIRELRARIRSD